MRGASIFWRRTPEPFEVAACVVHGNHVAKQYAALLAQTQPARAAPSECGVLAYAPDLEVAYMAAAASARLVLEHVGAAAQHGDDTCETNVRGRCLRGHLRCRCALDGLM